MMNTNTMMSLTDDALLALLKTGAVNEFVDAEAFAEALSGIEAVSDFNQCGYGAETAIQWRAIGGAHDLPVHSSEYSDSGMTERNPGAVPSFEMGAPGAFVLQTLDREVGVYDYEHYSWEMFFYLPADGTLAGDYRMARNMRDVAEFVGGKAQEICAALPESELNELACAIRAGRVELCDVRVSGFKKVQRALTVSTSYRCTEPDRPEGDAGAELSKSWTSSPNLVVGESYKGDYYPTGDARDYAEERRYAKPRFTFGQHGGWAVMKIARWADWPVKGSGNFSRTEFRVVLL